MELNALERLMAARKATVIIGVDPDIDRNGIAVYNKDTKRMNIFSLTFAEAIERIIAIVEKGEPAIVLVEGGWLNLSNWHFGYNYSKMKCAEIARRVGMNHECGILICEMLGYHNIPYHIIKPLEKHWKGKSGKISQEEITQFIPNLPKRMNQEERDAALIAWTGAGNPIRINFNNKPK